jgi:hypothetical protein
MRILIASIMLLIGSISAHGADVSTKDSTAGISPLVEVNPFAGLFGGVGVGAQSTDITITDPGSDEYFSGFNADGVNWHGFLGYNLCPVGSRVCAGIKGTYGFSDASVHFGAAGDVVEMQDYAQIVAALSVLAGKSTLLDVHGGYEWQSWEVGGTDADAGAWVVGAGIKTLVYPQLAVGINFDYLMFDNIEVDGLGSAGNDFLSDVLEDTDAFRVMFEASWHPGSQGTLSSLDNFRF